MRILWWSNAPWLASGYGVQTKLFLPQLRALGHEVAVCSNAGLSAGTIVWENTRVFSGSGTIGSEVVGLHSSSWGADITISLLDAWPIQPGAFAGSGMRWVPWFPVDSEPVQPSVIAPVRQAFESIVFSKFGERVALAAGLSPFYVPHGVDTSAYRPMDRKAARAALGCPEDCFLMGMVAANRGYLSRKSIPQVLQAFAAFSREHQDALLYLHMPSGEEAWGERVAMQIGPLADYLGIRRKLIMADEYSLLTGFSEAYMANLYNALDVLVSPSMGEGFGVPILEAQACGCPVLVGDWTSMSELCFAGHAIPKEEAEFMWTDLHGGQMLPHVAGIVRGMEILYKRRGDKDLRAQACRGAQAYDVARVTKDYWVPTLAGIQDRIRSRPARNRKAQLLLQSLYGAPKGAVAEIGCLRARTEVPSDGHSTLYLARECLSQGRDFTSVDLDPVVVDVANEVLREAGLPMLARVADGVEALRCCGALAMLYLDSSDDPSDTLQQLTAAELLPGGVVVVDDAQPAGANPFGKATLVVEHCGRRGQPFEIVQTEPGFAALVLRFPDGKAPLVLP